MSVPTSRDKREATRLRVDVDAVYSDGTTTIRGSVDDVSRSGLFMRVHDSTPVGTRGMVAMTLPDSAEPVHMAAEVVREHRSLRGLGLRFLDASHEARRVLANYMMRCAFRDQR